LFKKEIEEIFMSLDKIEFFGSPDRKGKMAEGKITSEFPAWYFENKINDLRYEIERNENRISKNMIPDHEIPRVKEENKRLIERLSSILKSKPKINGKDFDTLAGIYKDLTDQIGDSMFSRTEMKKGLVSAHEEAKRRIEPIIKVNSDCDSILSKFNISHVGGKISRNQADKVAKILGKIIDAPTNMEYYRKDHSYGTYKSEKSLEELEAGR